MKKTCSKCKVEKELDKFCKNSYSKDGRKARCKSCLVIEKKKWRQKNTEKIKQYAHEWRLKNLAKCKEVSKTWRLANLQKDKERIKRWRKANPEKDRERLLRHYYKKTYGEFWEVAQINNKIKRELFK